MWLSSTRKMKQRWTTDEDEALRKIAGSKFAAENWPASSRANCSPYYQ